MYNSPYCVHVLGSTDGQNVVLQPEYLENASSVNIRANISMNPSILAVPTYYKNKPESWEDALSLNSFPQMCIALDGYKAWVASGALDRLNLQTATSVARDTIKVAKGITNTVAGQGQYLASAQFGTEKGMQRGINQGMEGVGEIVDGAIDLANDIGNYMITLDVAKKLPPTIKGSFNTEILSTYNISAIFVRQMCINKDVAKSIDNYLTMFGYKVNTVKQPSIHNRKRFTYIKTRGCKANGGAPSTSISTIQAIFNKGIRFWVDPSDVGDYSTANGVL